VKGVKGELGHGRKKQAAQLLRKNFFVLFEN
jgi:hypothetical protein